MFAAASSLEAQHGSLSARSWWNQRRARDAHVVISDNLKLSSRPHKYHYEEAGTVRGPQQPPFRLGAVSHAGIGACNAVQGCCSTMILRSDRQQRTPALPPLPPQISDCSDLVPPPNRVIDAPFSPLVQALAQHIPTSILSACDHPRTTTTDESCSSRRIETSAPVHDSAKSRISNAILMEEARDGRCGVVYFNPGAKDTSELFARDSLPAHAAHKHDGEKPSHVHVDHDVRTLLDVDQGGFHEGESYFCLPKSCPTG
nr:hypothetical protein CFP56_58837 [Quercus suber]